LIKTSNWAIAVVSKLPTTSSHKDKVLMRPLRDIVPLTNDNRCYMEGLGDEQMIKDTASDNVMLTSAAH